MGQGKVDRFRTGGIIVRSIGSTRNISVRSIGGISVGGISVGVMFFGVGGNFAIFIAISQ